MKPNKTAILLGMYIGTSEEKKKMYQLNVMDWLKNTNYDIYTVDSSGQSINITHERLFEFSFKQEESESEKSDFFGMFFKKGTTLLEKDALLRLFKHYPNLFKYDMVFKITGKYFSPDLKSKYEKLPKCDMIIQHSHYINKLRILLMILIVALTIYIKVNYNKWINGVSCVCILLLYISYIYSYENTELVGATPRILHEFITGIADHCMEISLYQFILFKKISVHRLPPLSISRKYPKADGTILSYL